LEEARQSFNEELKRFNTAKENEFKNGIVFHLYLFQDKEIFVKIAGIEKEYIEKRSKSEARLKERITVLEKKIQELNE